LALSGVPALPKSPEYDIIEAVSKSGSPVVRQDYNYETATVDLKNSVSTWEGKN
jgi:hypothetical protein